jgi:MurNAc alpha-1-phosphate uridylyltransferase
MKVMILAAGLGSRMRDLTRDVPKPLLKVGNYSLIEHLILSLAVQGLKEIVINVSYLGEKIIESLGDGNRYEVSIQYSRETEPLEWGGGILQALPLLGSEPFLAVSGDLWTDFPFYRLVNRSFTLSENHLAHLVLVDDPECHQDYSLDSAGYVVKNPAEYTYSGIGIFHPELLKNKLPGKISFSQIMSPQISNQKITGEIYQGTWVNVGTPECLERVRKLKYNSYLPT